MWETKVMTTRAISFAALITAGCLTGTAVDAKPKAPLGQFQQQRDIGDTHFKGATAYTPKTGTYRITAGGANIWGKTDAFHFVAKPASGNIAIAANVTWATKGGDPHRKAGVMIRQSLAPDSPYADLVVHGNGLVSLQYREVTGGDTHEIQSNIANASRLRLERQGDYVYMSVAGPDGVLRHAGGVFRLKLDGPFQIGLAVCAHNNAVKETAVLSKVEITPLPAPPIAKGYGDKVESTLETIDIASSDRHVVYHTTDHIEAPNWTPDGKSFVFNEEGSIYTLPVTGGTAIKLDTGGLHKINNDHGISPDGKQLVISDQTSTDNQSRVYILPLTGGTPRQVTEQGPSYWHGWSPDGKTLAVIANRGGDYDVYAIPAAGGPETRLTATPGLDDGSEYSPDGQWIYFNSVRSGNMKIWRMHADGSNPQQVTFGDDSRDWFPHVSPDGNWIAFVSFGTDVTVGDHPPDRDVMLKIMPVPKDRETSGEPRIFTRLFGGQGTMNVPSWSPDSRSVAFVSYRVVP